MFSCEFCEISQNNFFYRMLSKRAVKPELVGPKTLSKHCQMYIHMFQHMFEHSLLHVDIMISYLTVLKAFLKSTYRVAHKNVAIFLWQVFCSRNEAPPHFKPPP